ncbi:MAG TPA: acyltransferase [Saprospiraceae bacterium]|nr:acyltransferase [Saprospiraceae bacterium]HMQ84368.1 acyltransferase [Saprospiraceae bacterium]
MNKRLSVIDYLKGFSMLTIVVFHYWFQTPLPSPIDRLIYFGGTGIHLFIFLSGFGLYASHLRQPLSYTNFLQKRLTKIYLPYIIVVLLSAGIAWFLPIFDFSWYALFGHIFLYKMFDNDIMVSYGYHFWFISMILQFYLVFHILVWIKKRWRDGVFLVFCLLLSLAWAGLVVYLGKQEWRSWNSFFLQYLWEFALGMLVAGEVSGFKIATTKAWFQDSQAEGVVSEAPNQLSHSTTRTPTSSHPYILQLIRPFLPVSSEASNEPSPAPWSYLLIGVAGCALYGALALKGGSIGKMFNDIPALFGYTAIALFVYYLRLKPLNRFLIFTGKISYALFLVHILVFLLLLYVFGQNVPSATLPVQIAALVLSYLAAYGLQQGINAL